MAHTSFNIQWRYPNQIVPWLRHHARVHLFRLLMCLPRLEIFIKDVKSSNGTFINQERLSPEGLESDPFELKTDDVVVCDSDQYSFDAQANMIIGIRY